jgi:hypothetical protein
MAENMALMKAKAGESRCGMPISAIIIITYQLKAMALA